MPEPWLDARQAAAVLGVKRATLYTYAGRGWVKTRRDPDHARRKRYHRGDLERLRSRSAAHSGAGPRASHALAWGEPVLTTAVSAIDADGPYYRGVAATDLVDRPLHRVAERLWGVESGPWPEPAALPGADLLAFRRTVDSLAHDDPDRAVWTGSTELDRARRLVVALGADLPADPLANAAQVVCVDHGLNASTLAARVVASTGADLYACVAAGLAAVSGPRHGTASLAVAALLDAFTRTGRSALVEMFQQRGGLPGFGHPLYPQGDPRAECLLERTVRISPDPVLADLVEAAGTLGLKPDLDLGLLAVCRASGWAPSVAPLLFASGRVVGWIAHVFEQRTSPGVLRPRAAYTEFARP